VGLTEIARSLRAALREFDRALHHADDCLALVEELAKTEKACAAARVLAASRVADCGAHRKAGFDDPADWLARASGSTAGQAERELTTAKRVEDMPDTKAALADGELSLDQAEEIAKTEKQCPGSEREMLDTARRDAHLCPASVVSVALRVDRGVGAHPSRGSAVGGRIIPVNCLHR